MTDSLNRGIDSRKEIDLWLLQITFCLLGLPSGTNARPVATKRPYGYIFVLCLSSDRIWNKVKWPEGRIIVGARGGSGSRSVGLCWSSTLLVQYEPMTWTQTWVQARMSDYSLNWTNGVQCYTKVSIMQLVLLKVAQAKLGVFRSGVCQRGTIPHPRRMPDGPAKKPSRSKANSKLCSWPYPRSTDCLNSQMCFLGLLLLCLYRDNRLLLLWF